MTSAVFKAGRFFFEFSNQNAPCMEYLPTFALECGHFSPNVGKYSLHGASGQGKHKTRWCERKGSQFGVGRVPKGPS